MFAGHLIARPELVYPTSHITGQDSWDETLARELLLKSLITFEGWLTCEVFDVHRPGHRMNASFPLTTEDTSSLHLGGPERERGCLSCTRFGGIESQGGAEVSDGWTGLRPKRNGLT